MSSTDGQQATSTSTSTSTSSHGSDTIAFPPLPPPPQGLGERAASNSLGVDYSLQLIELFKLNNTEAREMVVTQREMLKRAYGAANKRQKEMHEVLMEAYARQKEMNERLKEAMAMAKAANDRADRLQDHLDHLRGTQK